MTDTGNHDIDAKLVKFETPCVYNTAPSETHIAAAKRKHDDLEQRIKAFEGLHKMIRSLPEEQALEMFRHMRTTENAECLLRHVEGGELHLQLALKPESRYRYDFPVTKSMPKFLDQAGNPYMPSAIYERNFDTQAGNKNAVVVGADINSSPQQQFASYLTPYHGAKLVDSNIDSVQATRWTLVTSDNAMVQHLLELYFVNEHTTVPVLHKDLFLGDMATGRQRFCSSILVNAILASACV